MTTKKSAREVVESGGTLLCDNCNLQLELTQKFDTHAIADININCGYCDHTMQISNFDRRVKTSDIEFYGHTVSKRYLSIDGIEVIMFSCEDCGRIPSSRINLSVLPEKYHDVAMLHALGELKDASCSGGSWRLEVPLPERLFGGIERFKR